MDDCFCILVCIYIVLFIQIDLSKCINSEKNLMFFPYLYMYMKFVRYFRYITGEGVMYPKMMVFGCCIKVGMK